MDARTTNQHPSAGGVLGAGARDLEAPPAAGPAAAVEAGVGALAAAGKSNAAPYFILRRCSLPPPSLHTCLAGGYGVT